MLWAAFGETKEKKKRKDLHIPKTGGSNLEHLDQKQAYLPKHCVKSPITH